MLKLIVALFALAAVAQSLSLGGQYQQATVTAEVLDIAKWSASQLNGFTDVEGDHTVMTVRNLKTQVVSGINYRFTLDVLIASEDNKYFFRSCEMAVYVQPWTNTRQFIENPVCGPNPFYP